jgi:hypothetical protein
LDADAAELEAKRAAEEAERAATEAERAAHEAASLRAASEADDEEMAWEDVWPPSGNAQGSSSS